MKAAPSVSVAILTFRRPETLRTAIESIETASRSTRANIAEIIVVDNDDVPSAEAVVEELDWPIVRYVHENRSGVATARNRALDEAVGDILAFVDDDERAGPGWPDGLVDVMVGTGAALVGGPVRSVFSTPPPESIVRVGFFDRHEPDDRSEVGWLRSGNLALDVAAIRSAGLRFDESFNRSGGEDSRFSITAARSGLGLRWSATAVVYEDVTSDRISEEWVVRRSGSAMSSFMRANAPISLRFLVRSMLIAVARTIGGSLNIALGRLTHNNYRRLLGRIAVAQSRGAIAGCWRAITSGSERPAHNTHYVSG